MSEKGGGGLERVLKKENICYGFIHSGDFVVVRGGRKGFGTNYLIDENWMMMVRK